MNSRVEEYQNNLMGKRFVLSTNNLSEYMYAGMEFIFNPKNAQKLTEKVLLSNGKRFKLVINKKEVEIKQIGT